MSNLDRHGKNNLNKRDHTSMSSSRKGSIKNSDAMSISSSDYVYKALDKRKSEMVNVAANKLK